jgi:hypothetical protein
MKKLPHYPTAKGYSLGRAVSDAINNGSPALTFEAEEHYKIRSQFGKFATSTDGRYKVVYAPYHAFTRADILGGPLPTGNFPIFANTAPSYADSVIEHAMVRKAGASVLTGLEGSFLLTGTSPLPLPGSSSTPETTSPDSAPAFTGGSVNANSVIYSPQRIGVKMTVSMNLFRQSPEVFVPILKDAVIRSVSSRVNDLALFGSSTNGQILGLSSLSTVNPLGATPMTWVNYKTYRRAILQTDLQPDSYAVLMSPAFENYADSTVQFPASSFTIFTKLKDQSPVFVGNEVNNEGLATTKVLIAGLFRHLWLMFWGQGIELVLDFWSQMDSNQVVVRANLLFNIGCVFPAAFEIVRQN